MTNLKVYPKYPRKNIFQRISSLFSTVWDILWNFREFLEFSKKICLPLEKDKVIDFISDVDSFSFKRWSQLHPKFPFILEGDQSSEVLKYLDTLIPTQRESHDREYILKLLEDPTIPKEVKNVLKDITLLIPTYLIWKGFGVFKNLCSEEDLKIIGNTYWRIIDRILGLFRSLQENPEPLPDFMIPFEKKIPTFEVDEVTKEKLMKVQVEWALFEE